MYIATGTIQKKTKKKKIWLKWSDESQRQFKRHNKSHATKFIMSTGLYLLQHCSQWITAVMAAIRHPNNKENTSTIKLSFFDKFLSKQFFSCKKYSSIYLQLLCMIACHSLDSFIILTLIIYLQWCIGDRP